MSGQYKQMDEDLFRCGEPLSCESVGPNNRISEPAAAVSSTCSSDNASTIDVADSHTDRNAQLNSSCEPKSLGHADNADLSSCKNNVYNSPDSQKCVNSGRVLAVETPYSGNVEDRTLFIPDLTKAAAENLTGSEHICFIKQQHRNSDLRNVSAISDTHTSTDNSVSEISATTRHRNCTVQESVSSITLQAPTAINHITSHVYTAVEQVHSQAKISLHSKDSALCPIVQQVNSQAKISIHSKDSAFDTAVNKAIVNSEPSSQDIPPATQTVSHLSSSVSQTQKHDTASEARLLQQDAEFSTDTPVHSSNPPCPVTQESNGSVYPGTVDFSSSGLQHSSSEAQSDDQGTIIVAQNNDSVPGTISYKEKLQFENPLQDHNLDLKRTVHFRGYDMQATKICGSKIACGSENSNLLTQTVSHNLQNEDEAQVGDLDIQKELHVNSGISTARKSFDSVHHTSMEDCCEESKISQTTSNIEEHITHDSRTEDRIDTNEHSAGLLAAADAITVTQAHDSDGDCMILKMTHSSSLESSSTLVQESSLCADPCVDTRTATVPASHRNSVGILETGDACSLPVETVARTSHGQAQLECTDTENETVVDHSFDIQTAVEDTKIANEIVAQTNDPRIEITLNNTDSTSLAEMKLSIQHTSVISQSAVEGASLERGSNLQDGRSESQTAPRDTNLGLETALVGGCCEAQTAPRDTNLGLETALVGGCCEAQTAVTHTDVGTDIFAQESDLALTDSDIINSVTEINNSGLESSSAVHCRSQETKSNLQEDTHETQTNMQTTISRTPEPTKAVESTVAICGDRTEISVDTCAVEQDKEPKAYSFTNDNSFHNRDALGDDMDIREPNIIPEDRSSLHVMNTEALEHVENGNSGIQSVSPKSQVVNSGIQSVSPQSRVVNSGIQSVSPQSQIVNFDTDVNVRTSENGSTCKDNTLHEKCDIGPVAKMSKTVDALAVAKMSKTVDALAHSEDAAPSCTEHSKSILEDSMFCASREVKSVVDAGLDLRGIVGGHLKHQPCAHVEKSHTSTTQEKCSFYGDVEKIDTKLSSFGVDEKCFISTENIGSSLGTSVSENIASICGGKIDMNLRKSVDDDKTELSLGKSLDAGKTELSLGKSVDDDKTELCLGKSLDAGKTDLSLGKSVNDDKVDMSLGKSVGDDKTELCLGKSLDAGKTDLSLGKSVNDDKVDMSLGKSVGDDKTEPSLGKSVDDGKTVRSVGKFVDGDKTDMNLGKPLSDEKINATLEQTHSFYKINTKVDTSVNNKKTNTQYVSMVSGKIDGKSNFVGDEKFDTNLSASVNVEIGRNVGATIREKCETHLGTSMHDEKVETNLNTSVGNEKTDTNLGVSVSNEKSDTNLSASMLNEKGGTNLSASVLNEKGDTNLGASVGNEKSDTNLSASVLNEKGDTNLGASVGSEKRDINLSASVGNEKSDTNLSASVGNEKSDTNLSASVGDEKSDTNLSASVGDEKSDTNLSASVGDEKSDTNLSASVLNEKSDTNLSASVGDEKSDTNLSASVGNEKSDTNLSASMLNEKSDTNLSASVGNEKSDTNLSASVGNEKNDTNLSASVGNEKSDTNLETSASNEKIDTNASIYVSDGDDTNFSIYVSDADDTHASIYVSDADDDASVHIVSVSDADEDTRDTPEEAARKLPKLKVVLKRCDTSQASLYNHRPETPDSNSSKSHTSEIPKRGRKRKRSSDGSLIANSSNTRSYKQKLEESKLSQKGIKKAKSTLSDTNQTSLYNHRLDASDSQSSKSHTSEIPKRGGKRKRSDGSPIANSNKTRSYKQKLKESKLSQKGIKKAKYALSDSSQSSLYETSDSQSSESYTPEKPQKRKKWKRSSVQSLIANKSKTKSYKQKHEESKLTHKSVKKAKYTLRKYNNSKSTRGGKSQTGSNTARKSTTVYSKEFKPLRTCVYFNQNKKTRPSRYFNLRSLDVMRNLRSKAEISSKNGKRSASCNTPAQKKKNYTTKVKHKPPPESPPLDPTLPFVEVDLDIVVDESQYFEPIEPAVEETQPQPQPEQTKKKRGKPKAHKVSTGSNSTVSSGSQFIDAAACDLRHKCCQKAVITTSEMSTQWEDPSRWYAALETLTSKAMRSNIKTELTDDSTHDDAFIRDMAIVQGNQNYNLQEDQNYNLQGDQSYNLQGDQNYNQQDKNYNLQGDQNYNLQDQNYNLQDQNYNLQGDQNYNLQGGQNYNQQDQNYNLQGDQNYNLQGGHNYNLQGGHSYEQFNQQYLSTYSYENTTEDIKMAACEPLLSAFSRPGTVSSMPGNQLPAAAEDIPVSWPHPQSSHLFGAASSSVVPVSVTSVHQTSQDLSNSLNFQYDLQPDVHSDSGTTHSNNKHLKSRKKKSRDNSKDSSSTKDSHSPAPSRNLDLASRRKKKSRDISKDSASSTEDLHTAAAPHNLDLKSRKKKKSREISIDSVSSTEDSHTAAPPRNLDLKSQKKKKKKSRDISIDSVSSTDDSHTLAPRRNLDLKSQKKKSRDISIDSVSSTEDSRTLAPRRNLDLKSQKKKKSRDISKDSASYTEDSHTAAPPRNLDLKSQKKKKSREISIDSASSTEDSHTLAPSRNLDLKSQKKKSRDIPKASANSTKNSNKAAPSKNSDIKRKKLNRNNKTTGGPKKRRKDSVQDDSVMIVIDDSDSDGDSDVDIVCIE